MATPIPTPPANMTGGIDITEETIALVRQIREAEIKRAISLSTGLVGYDLATPAEVVVPIFTPVVNSTPRNAGAGIDIHHWKAITTFGWESAGSPPGVVDENVNPSQPAYNVANLFNIYQTIGVANEVSFKAEWRGRSLEGSVRAKRMAELLYILKLIEEQWLIYYSDYLWALPTPLAPTTAATGGTVAAGTYFVGVTARTANGETPVTVCPTSVVTTGTTSTVTFTFFGEPLATGYNVYMGTSVGATFQVASANLKVNNVVQTGNPATTGSITQTVPTLGTNNITVTITAPVSATAAPTVNTAIVSKGANNLPLTFNGHLAMVMGGGNASNYYPNGANTAPNGSFTAAGQNYTGVNVLGELGMAPTIIQPAATNGKLAYTDLTNLLTIMFQQARANPDYIAISPADQVDFTNLLINQAGTRVSIGMLPDQLGNLTLGNRVTQMLNPITGKLLEVQVWPFMPQGYILVGSRSLPFPIPGFDGPIAQVLTNIEYYGIDYPPTAAAPKFSFADYVDETLQIQYLGGFGLITGIIP